MPGPTVTPFVSDPVLPKQADVVVIGGGIVGVATALELAERGVSVLLCEKGVIGGEQSSRNWGWVRIGQRDARELALMREATRLWQGMQARTGRDVGYRQCGIFFAARTAKELARNARWAAQLHDHGVAARTLAGRDLDALYAGHAMKIRGGLYTPGDGRAEPQWAAPAMAEAARAAGAVVMTGCAVRAIDTGAGRIAGVITEKGRVRCSAVVLAGGAWSRLFAAHAGVYLPQLKVLNSVMRSTPLAGPETALWTNGFTMRKRADGGYIVASGTQNTVDIVPDSFRLARAFLPALMTEWCGLRFRLSARWRQEAGEARPWAPDEVTPFERCRVLDPAPSQKELRSGWSAAQQAFPVFQNAKVVQGWAGLIDVTPDAVPVISAVADLAGLHIATGFSGHGFGIGPAAGRLMADLVTGAAPVVDPHAFRLSRFSDGSRIRPDHGA
jgi:glycine/D-amino acid oxidase-like deaminating enzyme